LPKITNMDLSFSVTPEDTSRRYTETRAIHFVRLHAILGSVYSVHGDVWLSAQYSMETYGSQLSIAWRRMALSSV